jgi:hypothetical protein
MVKSARRPLLDGRWVRPFILAGIVMAIALAESPGAEDQPVPNWGSPQTPRIYQPKPHAATAKRLADFERWDYAVDIASSFMDKGYTPAAIARMQTLDNANVTLTCFIVNVDSRSYFGPGPTGTILLGFMEPVELPPGWRSLTMVRILGTKEQAAKISIGDVLTMRGMVRVIPNTSASAKEDTPKYCFVAPTRNPSRLVLALNGFEYTITPASQAPQTKAHGETAKFLADYQHRTDEFLKGKAITHDVRFEAHKAALDNVPLTLNCCITSVYAVPPDKDQPAGSIGLSLTLPAELPPDWGCDTTVRIPGGAAQMAKIHLGDTLIIRGSGNLDTGYLNRKPHSGDNRKQQPLSCFGLSPVGPTPTLALINFDYTIVPAAPVAKATPTSGAAKTSPTAAPPANLP